MTMVFMARRYGRLSLIPTLLLSALTPLFSSEAQAAPPGNDKCPGAEVIPPTGPFPHLSTLIPDLGQATTMGDATPSCVTTFSRGVWYSFTPEVTAEYQVSTCNPPTGTTIFDTVLAIYTSSNGTCTGAMTELVNGCSDDECQKRSALFVTLTAGTTYYIVASKWGAGLPPAGETAMQVEVTKAPSNDSCINTPNLPLDKTINGSLTLATNDYEVSTSGPNCYSLPTPPAPVGQPAVPSTAPGRDVTYSFTAPADGSYSFKAQATQGGGNIILHVAATCPTGAGPHTLTDCLGASDRNTNIGDYAAAEEISCLPLMAGQTVYVYVDERVQQTAGVRFTLEATSCQSEAEPNDDPTQAAALSCGLSGNIFPFDEDYYSLGSPAAGTRVFAMADGVAGNTTDFDMRITTETDTLEYDDANNSAPWGEGSPNIAGCPLNGGPSFLKMNAFDNMTAAEPYHLYTVLQPPGSGLGGSSATPENEPNDTTSGATTAGNLFFSGTISTGGPAGDMDLYKFCAEEGSLIYLSIDGDPLRDETPIDPSIFLLDAAGNRLLAFSDGGNFSVAFPSPNTLSGTSPRSPGETALFRATYSGVHYAGVNTQFDGVSYGTGDYLYSIGLDCLAGNQIQADLGITITDTPDPVGSNETLELKVDVINQGPRTALDAAWSMTIPAATTFVSFTAPPEWTCTMASNDIDCTTTCFPANGTVTFDVKLQTKTCILPGMLMHSATVTSKTPDKNTSNDIAMETTEVVDGGPCDDGNVCTAADTCTLGVCMGGPPNDCNDGNVCTDEVCLPGSGCKYTNNTNTCDDSNTCTTADKCNGGSCVGGPPVVCNDGDDCTDDTCDSVIGCVTALNTAPCEDGNPCSTNDTCSSGVCISGPPAECAPLNDCQEAGVCNPQTGACAYYLKPDGTTCDDGNACSTNETCKFGACIAADSTVCPPPPDKCHGAGTCDPKSGSCMYPIIGGDLDGDGQGNDCDSDTDGDGISNDEEAIWGTNPLAKDSDGDDIDDCTEACSENDGSCFDGSVCTIDRPANTDGDDTIDALDSDSDNDGASDAAEAGDTDLTTPATDTNNDGLPDYRDPNIVNGEDDVVLSGGCGCSVLGEKNQAAMTGLSFSVLGLMTWGLRRKRRVVTTKKLGTR